MVDKKKVLFIGPYRQNDGWSRAARSYIYALNKACYLMIRPVYMGSSIDNNLDEVLMECEERDFKADILIQNVLPHLLDYNGLYKKNIGLFYTETKGWQNTWPSKTESMDEIWVPSLADKANIEYSCDQTNIKVVPIPNDFYKQEKKGQIRELEGTFNFYFIGEFSERKNIEGLISAYLSEFHYGENVRLVIKTHRGGMDYNELGNFIGEYIDRLKEQKRIFNKVEKYPEIVLITDYLADQDIVNLHYSCHCFVVPSCGESWCIPAMDAASIGNVVLSTDKIGPSTFFNIKSCQFKSIEEYVCVKNPPLNDLYTGQEVWHRPSTLSIAEKMRGVFNRRNQKSLSAKFAQLANNITTDHIASQISKLLN